MNPRWSAGHFSVSGGNAKSFAGHLSPKNVGCTHWHHLQTILSPAKSVSRSSRWQSNSFFGYMTLQGVARVEEVRAPHEISNNFRDQANCPNCLADPTSTSLSNGAASSFCPKCNMLCCLSHLKSTWTLQSIDYHEPYLGLRFGQRVCARAFPTHKVKIPENRWSAMCGAEFI